jgi:hypothetical protein
LNSGASGSDNSLSYALDGTAGSAWAPIDFSRGVVMEVRARAGNASTAEGSASIILGDGIHGAVTLELDSDSVNLEGLGGAAGQVEYSSLVHPEFSSRAWHDYRLWIQPQASAGGAILAQLFLDGDYSTPILSQQLAPSALDEIRFGDLTGTNNGVLELDYLRFAPLPGVTVAGDYNADGQVDQADYVTWRRYLGTNHILPNDTSPGSVTLDDYNVLRSNYGATAGNGASIATGVPEPTVLLYTVSLVFGFTPCVRRRFR